MAWENGYWVVPTLPSLPLADVSFDTIEPRMARHRLHPVGHPPVMDAGLAHNRSELARGFSYQSMHRCGHEMGK